jgi:hypothetical protein
MVRLARLVVLLLALGPAAEAADGAPSEEDAGKFFARYVALSDAFDPAVAELYADRAVIRSVRRYPHGLERAIELGGVEWKAMVLKAMPLAKAHNDRSQFKDPSFQPQAGGIKISAQRYSLRKCYLDPNYYMVVARSATGGLEIIEEYSETQPQSNC